VLAPILAPIQDDVVVPLRAEDTPAALVELRATVTGVLLRGGRTVVVDVSELDRLPASVLSALLWAHRRCAARGGHIVLRSPQRAALDQLRRTGLEHIFRVDVPVEGAVSR
jgi:anti-anti-sigma factor